MRGLLAVLLLGLAALALLVSFPDDRADPVLMGGNLPINRGATDLADISAHNSPSVARNPADAANLVVVNRIDSPLFSCAFHASFDGGATWTPTTIPLPENEEPKCYAPDVAFDSDGTMFLSFATLAGEGNTPNAIWTARSVDGGRTLSRPSKALGPLAFQVRLAADPDRPSRLYLTWLQAESTVTLGFGTDANPIRSARSDDGGETWSEPVQVNDPDRTRVVAPALAAGRSGELFVSYLDLVDDRLDYTGAHEGIGGEPSEGPWRLMVARSIDAGATWSESVVDDVVPTERFIVFIPPTPSLAVDEARGRVYVAFQDGRLGDADTWVWTSRDEGLSFGEAVRVNDTPTGDATSQYMPELAVAPDGRLDVVYYDRRSDPDNIENGVSFQSSPDAAKTFTPHLQLSDRAFDSRIGFGSERGMPDLGNRLALLSTEARALAVWSDTRAGTDASRKQDLVRAVVAIPREDEAQVALSWGLRAGAAVFAIAALSLIVPRRRHSIAAD